jgi:hypothetical protein
VADPNDDARIRNEVLSEGLTGQVFQARDVHGPVTIGSALESSRIEVSVELDQETIETAPPWQQYATRWIGIETAKLRSAADSYDWQENSLRKVVRRSWSRRNPLLKANLTAVAGGGLAAAGGLAADRRTRRMYEEHVELFAEQAYRVFEQRALLQLEGHEGASLRMSVRNPTDFNFGDVAVRLRFDSPVLGFSDDLRRTLPSTRPELPRLPPPPGITSPARLLLWAMFVLELPPDPVVTRAMSGVDPAAAGWSGHMHAGGFEVTYDQFSLRPREVRSLPPVPLTVLLSPGSELSGHWSATALSANGVAEGQFALPVVETSADLSELDRPGPREDVPTAAEVRSWYADFGMLRRVNRRVDWL